MRYIIRSGPQVYQAATPQDALALGEQMAAEGMEDVWIIDQESPAFISTLETLRDALKTSSGRASPNAVAPNKPD